MRRDNALISVVISPDGKRGRRFDVDRFVAARRSEAVETMVFAHKQSFPPVLMSGLYREVQAIARSKFAPANPRSPNVAAGMQVSCISGNYGEARDRCGAVGFPIDRARVAA